MGFRLSEPANFIGVVGGMRFSANPAAKEIDEHKMIERMAVVVGQHPVVHSQQVSGFNSEGGLLTGFAYCRFAQSLAELKHASWNRPFSGKRWVPALYQQHPAILN